MNPPPYDLHHGLLVIDTVYTRCPTCDIVAPPGAISYGLASDGTIDAGQPLLVDCIPGEHRYTVNPAALFARDAVGTCPCGTTFTCPAEADETVCPSCHQHQPGPFLDLDPERRDYIHRIHEAHLRSTRDQLRRWEDGTAN